MDGGNRGILAVAIVGLMVFSISAGASLSSLWREQQRGYPAYKESGNNQGGSTPAARAQPAVDASEYKQPCSKSEGRDESDLCAQWLAASAARDAANWAWWQLILSFFGVMGLGMTLWFNKRAIDIALASGEDTERALSIAARSADAAQRQAQIAAEESEARTRAYVYVKGVTTGAMKGRVGRQIKVLLSNFGHTPAHNIKVRHCAVLAVWPCDEDPRFDQMSEPKKFSVIPQGEPATVIIDVSDMGDEWEDKLRRGEAALYLRIECEYEFRPRPRDSVTTGFTHVFGARPDDIQAGVFRLLS